MLLPHITILALDISLQVLEHKLEFHVLETLEVLQRGFNLNTPLNNNIQEILNKGLCLLVALESVFADGDDYPLKKSL